MYKTLITCYFCGKESLKRNCDLKASKHIFCSSKCYFNYKAEISINKNIGRKYGQLKIISFAYTKNGKSYVNCECDCGNKCIKPIYLLKSLRTCGKCNNEFKFMRYVEIIDDKTWLWRGCVGYNKYGKAYYNGKVIDAHRVSYMLFKGEIPKGMCVCHGQDDDPLNICPKNLWLGSQHDNCIDMYNKGRNKPYPHNREHRVLKLTNEEDSMIKNLYKTGNYTYKILSEMFSVSHGTIHNTLNNKYFREI